MEDMLRCIYGKCTILSVYTELGTIIFVMTIGTLSERKLVKKEDEFILKFILDNPHHSHGIPCE
jgi:hypothetical protein